MSGRVVFCLPHAGGGIHSYLGWARALSSDFDWQPLDYAGDFTRADEPRYRDFDHAARDLSATVARIAEGRDIGLFGHSMGASFAFEIAHRLTVADATTSPMAVVLSGATPPHPARDATGYFDLPDDQLLAYLHAQDTSTSDWPHDLLAEYLAVVRAHLRLHHSYAPPADTQITVPLEIWSGADEQPRPQPRQWQPYTSNTLRFREFAGGHFFWRTTRGQTLAALRAVFASNSHPIGTAEK